MLPIQGIVQKRIVNMKGDKTGDAAKVKRIIIYNYIFIFPHLFVLFILDEKGRLFFLYAVQAFKQPQTAAIEQLDHEVVRILKEAKHAVYLRP